MARFQFNLRQLLTSRATSPAVVQRALHDFPLDDGQAAPQGPGWFDSSFDLSHGLEVRDAGDGGYDDWLTARAIAERRAAAKRSARPARSAVGTRRVVQDDATLDLADLARCMPAVASVPAPRKIAATTAPREAQDDFSRFDIEGLSLA
jgi:hypothetical protein